MSNQLTDEQVDKVKYLLTTLDIKVIDALLYIVKDYSSEKEGRKATPSLIDLKLETYDEKLTLALDNRKHEMLKSLATSSALNRVDKNLSEKIDVLVKVNSVLDKRLSTLESDKKGLLMTGTVVLAIIASVWAILKAVTK